MRHLVVGCGVAGITAAQNIRKTDPDSEITILTEEPYPFYSRIRLIDFLTGTLKPEALVIKKEAWYKDNRIGLLTNTKATNIDVAAKTVSTSAGTTLPYDRLLLATGGVSFIPPLVGADKNGVFALRTMSEAVTIVDYAKTHKRVLVIGGGLLGLEAGNSLLRGGNDVTVVEFFPRLLPRQMDKDGAEILKGQLERMGFKFILGVKPKEILGEENSRALLLEDGREIEFDMTLISAGVRPNSALAKSIGLKIEKGVVVNDRMETEIENIFAAGDVIQHRDVFYGIWPASEKQGEVAGTNMAGGNATYDGTPMANTLKVAGIALFSAGDIDADGKHEAITRLGEKEYKKLVISDGVIIGAILFGDTKGSQKIIGAMAAKKNVEGIRKNLESWDMDW
jgi:nitrite reductase (NADH) large subunit